MKKYYKIFIIVILVAVFIGIFFLLKNNKLVTNKIKILNTNSDISAVIVPHHDLVKDKRDNLLKEISTNNQPETIILVSPNHFLSGSYDITTTNQIWKLQNGEILPDNEKISELLNSGVIFNEEIAFNREHGIRNLLSEISTYFPKTKIIPIIIKENTDSEKIKQLAQNLYSTCSKNCLLIASVDFSHYQPGALAEIHDNLSIRALSNLDESLLARSEVDSRESLLLAIKWAKLQNNNQFVLKENTNSGKISNERDAESTSYVFGYWQKGGQKNIDNEFAFMIGGDMMFDRFIDHNFPGNKLKDSLKNLGNRFFDGADLSLINLEGPINSGPIESNTNPNNVVFNFPLETANVLKWLNINAVSLANNHTNNAGQSGLENTQKILNEKKINHIGQQFEFNDNSIERFSYGSQKISVIAIDILDNYKNLNEIIKTEKQNSGFVLVFPHWGNEFEKTHSALQQRLAYAWIDTGADLIIGSHPHVIQDAEIYKEKMIFYSLGNLLFDQTFSTNTQRGLVLAGAIKDNKLEKIVLIPTVSKNLQPQLLTGQEKTDLLTNFRDELGLKISNKDYGYDIIDLK